MLNRRYHIHVACTADAPADLMDSLALFFERRAFLTYDLLTNQAETAGYSRRCIDSCDYVLLLVADSYGERNNTGVSQLHLSYVYAKTKNKPMVVLVKTHNDEEVLPRQLRDFITLVEQHVGQVNYFNDETDMGDLLSYTYNELQQQHPLAGWLPAKDSISEAIQNSVQRTPSSPNKEMLNLESRPDTEVDTSFENLLREVSSQSIKSSTAKTFQSQAPVSSANFLAQDPHSSSQKYEPHIEEKVHLHYSAHAYAKGNLSDVSMSVSVSWLEIVASLIKIPSPFSSYGLQRCLNALVSKDAEEHIKNKMPNVHAVSRCQVVAADIQDIQEQLYEAGWIKSLTNHQRHSRELWHVTERAKQLVADTHKTLQSLDGE